MPTLFLALMSFLIAAPVFGHGSSEGGSPAGHRARPTADQETPRFRAFGRVVDSDGRPVVGLRAVLYASQRRWGKGVDVGTVRLSQYRVPGLEVLTGADGSFELEGPMSDAKRMEFRLDGNPYLGIATRGFGDVGFPKRPLLVEGDNDLGEFVLPVTGALEGNVLDESGQPIEGVIVRRALSGTANYLASTRTDGNGRYVLGHLHPGRLEITASREGYLEVAGYMVEAIKGETHTGPSITLVKAPVLGGVVVGPDGQPVANLRLHGRSVDTGRGSGTKTRSDGTFEMSLPTTGRCRIEFEGDEHFQPWGKRLIFRQAFDPKKYIYFEPGTIDIRIELEALVSQVLRVIDDAENVPLEFFEVSVRHSDSGQFPKGRAFKSEEAEVGVVPGLTCFLVTAPGYISQELVAAEAVSAEPSDKPLVVRLARGSALTGRIMANGAPVTNALMKVAPQIIPNVPGAEIDLFDFAGDTYTVGASGPGSRPAEIRTGTDGRFRFEGLPPGTYCLEASGDGGAPTKFENLAVGADEATDLGDVSLGKECRVEGRVLLGAGQSPGGLGVRVGFGFFRDEERIGADGVFSIGGLAPGEHELYLEPDGVRVVDHVRQAFTVLPGETAHVDIDLSNSLPVSVTVRVRDAGLPVASARVAFEQIEPAPGNIVSGTSGSLAETDADGGFAGTVVSGRTYVAVVSEGRLEIGRSEPFNSGAGDSIHLDVELATGSVQIVLPKGVTFPDNTELRARFMRQRPPGEAPATLDTASFSKAGSSGASRPWTTGELSVPRVPPGPHVVWISATSLTVEGQRNVLPVQHFEVVVKPGESSRIELAR